MRVLADGFVAPGFEGVAEQLERNFAARGEIGAAFAAVLDGRPVADLWGGLADRAHGRPWREDTLAMIFSGTKGLVATCLLLLIERGRLELEAPVARYWPAFAAHGKEGVLVRHVVSHQAGLPGLTTAVTPEEATDDVRMAALLADQPLAWAPGARLCYHAMTFGWLCGELVRRVDGRSVGRFFAEEVARPLALEAWIGLPTEHDRRVAVLEPGPGFGTQPRDLRAAHAEDRVAWSIWANPPRFSGDPLPVSMRSWRAAEIPSSNGVACARSLARLYGHLAAGGEDGFRLLAPRTLALGTTRLAAGVDPYLEEPLAFGVGFQLQTEAAPFGAAPVGYGHAGAGGSVHGAWPELRTGFSYVTSRLCESRGADPRSAALLDALHEAVCARRDTQNVHEVRASVQPCA
jgi:CubicO group peptidase (beta-lactamase class C family)